MPKVFIQKFYSAQQCEYVCYVQIWQRKTYMQLLVIWSCWTRERECSLWNFLASIETEILRYFICASVNGGHLLFTIYPDVGECSHQSYVPSCWTPKMWVQPLEFRCYRVQKLRSTSGLAAAILNLSFSSSSISTGGNGSYSRIHCFLCYKCF